MLGYLFDFMFVSIVLGVAFFVSRGRMVHSAAHFVAVLLASLLAVSSFERIVQWIDAVYLSTTEEVLGFYLPFFTAVVIFAVCLAVFVWGIHRILPEAPEVSPQKETAGRWVFGVMNGYLIAAFLLTIIQTFPGPQDFWGTLPPDTGERPGPILSIAPDYQFLALSEYTIDHAFPVRGKWLLKRPVIPAARPGGRWSSFPYRYQEFRSSIEQYYRGIEEETVEKDAGKRRI